MILIVGLSAVLLFIFSIITIFTLYIYSTYNNNNNSTPSSAPTLSSSSSFYTPTTKPRAIVKKTQQKYTTTTSPTTPSPANSAVPTTVVPTTTTTTTIPTVPTTTTPAVPTTVVPTVVPTTTRPTTSPAISTTTTPAVPTTVVPTMVLTSPAVPTTTSPTVSTTFLSQPINGGWSDWILQGSCDKECDGGVVNRQRYCNNPTPMYNGNDCLGSNNDTIACNTQSCPPQIAPKNILAIDNSQNNIFNGQLVYISKSSNEYLDSTGSPPGSKLKIWKDKHTNTQWELTSDRHIKSNVGNVCISGTQSVLIGEECANIPSQLWNYSVAGSYFQNDAGFYITSTSFGNVESGKIPTTWSITNILPQRKKYSFGGITLKDFNDTIIDLGNKFNDWNPSFNQGIPVMDANGDILFLSLVYSYQKNIPWTLTWFTNSTKNVLDLTSFFFTSIGESDPYNNYEGTNKIIFNTKHEAFALVNLNKIVKFDYKQRKLLDVVSTDIGNGVMGRIENKFHTNNPFYNNYPILVNIKKPITISLYNERGRYITYTAPLWTDSGFNATKYISTAQHSGRNSSSFTVNGITYICFGSIHNDPWTKGTPQWITSFKHSDKSWSNPVLLGYGGRMIDEHNAPSITITSKGIIYVFFGNHIDLAYYCKTSVPYKINSFSSPTLLPSVPGQGYTDSRLFTYPACNIDKKDNIYVTYRGPWYAFTLWKINTSTGKIIGNTLFDNKKPIKIEGNQRNTGIITSQSYTAWRDVMTIDNNNNLYIYFYPKADTATWDSQPHSLTGPFVLLSTDGGSSFKIIE
jgi:hypothetical protein